MRGGPLLKACGVAAVCVAASFLVFRGGPIGVTFAFFDAETVNAGSAFSGGWLDTPTAFTITTSGNTPTLNWTGGVHAPSTGGQQAITGAVTASSGTSTTCPSTLSSLTSVTYASGANSYPDTNRGIGIGGEHYCYGVATTAGTQWTSSTATAVTQIPFFAYSLTIANGGSSSSGTIDGGDTITIVFNNVPSGLGATGTLNVCAWKNTTNTVILGDSQSCKSSTATGSIGTLALSGRTISANATFSGSAYALSGDTLTITLAGKKTAGLSGSGTASWTYTPNTGLQEGSGAGAVTICTSSASGCTTQTTPSSNF
jgi:hypothetical protein